MKKRLLTTNEFSRANSAQGWEHRAKLQYALKKQAEKSGGG